MNAVCVARSDRQRAHVQSACWRRARSRFRQLVASTLIVSLTSGCYKWVAQPGLRPVPERARLTVRPQAGTGYEYRVELRDLRLVGDRLYGTTYKPQRTFAEDYEPGRRVEIALADIARVEARKHDGVATAALVIVPLLGLVGIGIALANYDWCCSPDSSDF